MSATPPPRFARSSMRSSAACPSAPSPSNPSARPPACRPPRRQGRTARRHPNPRLVRRCRCSRGASRLRQTGLRRRHLLQNHAQVSARPPFAFDGVLISPASCSADQTPSRNIFAPISCLAVALRGSAGIPGIPCPLRQTRVRMAPAPRRPSRHLSAPLNRNII